VRSLPNRCQYPDYEGVGADAPEEAAMSERLPDKYPPRHDGAFLVHRPGVGDFIATVCYGMHAPWWCFDANTSVAPMQDGDEWQPWPIGRALSHD
jgi:hypothetical protein